MTISYNQQSPIKEKQRETREVLSNELAEMKGNRAQQCDALRLWKTHSNWTTDCGKEDIKRL